VKIDRLPENHVVERYLDTVSFFNVVYDGQGLDYFIPEGQEYQGNLPPLFRDGYIAFIIGGTYTTKRLPAGKVVEICQNSGYPFILIGGEEEASTGDQIEKMAGD